MAKIISFLYFFLTKGALRRDVANVILLKEMRISMNAIVLCMLSFAVVALVPWCGAVSEDFSRYQGILDRKPFGEPPPDLSQSTNAIAAASEAFTKTLKMVAIKQDQSGRVRVGFVNLAAGNKSSYLMIGESNAEGIELVDADFDLESALVRKGVQSGWIYMKSSPQQGVAVAGKKAPAPLSEASMANAVQQKRVTLYAELLRKRHEGKDGSPLSGPPHNAKMTGAQLEKYLKDYQMDQIRKGLKPLPIPLTREMDDQLVAEGVLPAIPSK